MSSSDPYDLARSILQKLACIFSSLGSLMIISSVLRNKANRNKTQQRLLLGISCCDLLTSITWLFTDLLMPPRGNQNTCEAQGFLIQFGNTSNVIYMVALQLQYLFTIKYGWKEEKTKKIEGFLLLTPIMFGLGTAIAALVLDLYNPADWDCWIAPYPSGCTESYEISNHHGSASGESSSGFEETDCIRGDNAQIYQWAFFFAPLWAAIAFCIVVMSLVIKSVKAVEEKTAGTILGGTSIPVTSMDVLQKPAVVPVSRITVEHTAVRETSNIPCGPGQGHCNQIQGNNIACPSVTTACTQSKKPKLALTARVRRQCILYAMGFFVVWSFPTIARFIQLIGGTIHPILGVFSGCFIATQGLWNAMIYFRPKYSKIERDRWWEKIWVLVQSTLLCCVHINAFGLTVTTFETTEKKRDKSRSEYQSTQTPITTVTKTNTTEVVKSGTEGTGDRSWVNDRHTSPCSVNEERQDFKCNGSDCVEYPV